MIQAHIQAFKEAIETNIRGKLGEERIEELCKEKKFLALPDDLDI